MDLLLDVSQLPSDEQLAADATRESSNGPAFKALVERHRERVWRICFRLLGNEQDAHDAAQEVFVRLFLQRARFSGLSKYTTWVHAIAVRTCLAIRRARGRRHRHEASAGVAHSEQARPTADLAAGLDLTRMLETLDEEDRAIVILKYAEDYSYEELAEIFGLSTSACKMRVMRAKERLQQRFGEATPKD